MSGNPIIWEPDADRQQASAMYRFMQLHGFDNYDALHRWSIDDSPAFWEALCDFCQIHFDRAADTTLARPDNIMDAGWFEGSQLNFAAHLLRHAGSAPAVVFCGEDGTRTEMSRDELRVAVAAVAAALRGSGVTAGDRVVGYLPNCPAAIVAMLATTSMGAIWSSC